MKIDYSGLIMFKLFTSKSKKPQYGWFGDYSNWDELVTSADGYNAENILNKTKDALLQVKNGTAVYERDSVLFDKIVPPFPLLTCLFRSATLLKRPTFRVKRKRPRILLILFFIISSISKVILTTYLPLLII